MSNSTSDRLIYSVLLNISTAVCVLWALCLVPSSSLSSSSRCFNAESNLIAESGATKCLKAPVQVPKGEKLLELELLLSPSVCLDFCVACFSLDLVFFLLIFMSLC